MGVVAVIFLLIAVAEVVMYNRLVKGRVHVSEAFSGIDVQFKRRHDLIPNLVEAVKGYLAHEKNVMTEVVNLRSRAIVASDIKERASAENGLSQALKTIFAVAENYPDLKANQNFLNLHQALVDIEDEIQLARRYYNGTVRNFNILVQSFPGNIVAGIFHFAAAEFFELESSTERANVEVKISRRGQGEKEM